MLTDALFWLLVLLSLPLQGGPFILLHHYAFAYTHRHLLEGRPRPQLQWDDLWAAWGWGLVMCLFTVFMWNLCGYTALQSYGLVFCLALVQTAWDVLSAWRRRRRGAAG